MNLALNYQLNFKKCLDFSEVSTYTLKISISQFNIFSLCVNSISSIIYPFSHNILKLDYKSVVSSFYVVATILLTLYAACLSKIPFVTKLLYTYKVDDVLFWGFKLLENLKQNCYKRFLLWVWVFHSSDGRTV